MSNLASEIQKCCRKPTPARQQQQQTFLAFLIPIPALQLRQRSFPPSSFTTHSESSSKFRSTRGAFDGEGFLAVSLYSRRLRRRRFRAKVVDLPRRRRAQGAISSPFSTRPPRCFLKLLQQTCYIFFLLTHFHRTSRTARTTQTNEPNGNKLQGCTTSTQNQRNHARLEQSCEEEEKAPASADESTIHTETSTVCSIEEGEQYLFEDSAENTYVEIELQPTTATTTNTTATPWLVTI
ncbi:hypothetical protein KSP39_PZI004004 [Platanthera zijinensis]|uniref:Uncharacterized protein n=1 Tax=Platanthera zijinensis TaxID=2320716 RepID=A0AAP0BYA6_9ASPA